MTELQNTELLAMGGLGNKRGIWGAGGTRQQKRQRDVLKRSLVDVRLLARWKRRNRARSRRDVPSGTCWDSHRQRGRRQSCTPRKKEEEEGGEGMLVGTAATSTSPGRILLSRMGGAQVWGVAASPWFPLRYPSRTEHHPPWMACPPGGSSCWHPLWAPRRPRRGW